MAASTSLPTNPHPARGYLFIAAATFFWGFSATMGRAVFTGKLLLDARICARSILSFSPKAEPQLHY